MSMGDKKRTACCGTASAAAVLFSISIHSPASSKAFGFPETRTRPSVSLIKVRDAQLATKDLVTRELLVR